MRPEFDETIYFQHCRTLDGRIQPIDLVRRNGKPVPRFSPAEISPSDSDSGPSELKQLLRELMYGLNRTQRRTWLHLLLGSSIFDIAAAEGVSRTAIYERIRGNSKGQGGMIAKNDYVAIWWKLRHEQESIR